MKINWKQKLASRKLWVTVLSMIVGILGALGTDDNTIRLVSGVGLVLLPAIVYVFREGKIDEAALSKIDADAFLAAIQAYIANAPSQIAANIVAEENTLITETEDNAINNECTNDTLKN